MSQRGPNQIKQDAEIYAASRVGTGPEIVRLLLGALELAERERDALRQIVDALQAERGQRQAHAE